MCDGTVYGCGYNIDGRLGDGTTTTTSTLVAMTTDGTNPITNVSRLASSVYILTFYNNLPSGEVTITGTNQFGQTLSLTNTIADTDGIGSFSYQWYRNSTQSNSAGTSISDATSSTYILVAADVYKYIYAIISYTDNNCTVETITSSPTDKISISTLQRRISMQTYLSSLE
jgi:hypothetical protein